jgi:hypothetical protein
MRGGKIHDHHITQRRGPLEYDSEIQSKSTFHGVAFRAFHCYILKARGTRAKR